MEEQILSYLERHQECYDRSTFDKVFRFLLSQDYDHEEAKDLMLFHCAFSALTLQERIHNDYYLQIKANQTISEDLQELRSKMFNSDKTRLQ